MARRHSTRLTDYRAMLDSKGDIAFGAYARAQQRRRIVIGLAGLALIGAAIGLHFLVRPERQAVITGKTRVLIRCVSCGYEGVVSVAPGEADVPMVCPKCAARTCKKVWECRDCGQQFFPKGLPGDTRCPQCNSTRVGTAEHPAVAPQGK
jgi:predicted Zn-ribbon and HTH transcriptional regulator